MKGNKLMDLWQNKLNDSRGLRACAAVAVLTAIVAVIWCLMFMTQDHTIYEMATSNTPFGEITAEHSLVQELHFDSEETITDISIMLATYGRVDSCQVDFSLHVNESEVYHYTLKDAAGMKDNSYFKLSGIHADVKPEDRVHLLITSPDGQPGNAITAWTDSASDPGLPMYSYDSVSGVGQRVEGKVRLSVGGAIDHRLQVFWTVIFVCAVLFAAVIFALLFLSAVRIERLVFVSVVALGMLYTVIMTPMSIPDEPRHYQAAYKLSNYMLFQWDSIEYGEAADFDYHGLVGHHNTPDSYIRVMEDAGQPAAEGDTVLIPYPNEISYFVEYIPQAVGISIGRLLGLSFVLRFYLGRICNLLFYAVCCYFAVKRAPKFKLLLGLLSIMPMALHQAGSFSLDAFINGMSFLLIAEMLRAILGTGPLSKADFVRLVIFGALLAPTKIVYGLLMALTILIPAERFGGGKKKAKAIACAAAVCVAVLAVFQLSSVAYWTGAEADPTGLWSGDAQNYSISFLLHHPIATARVFLISIRQQYREWLECSIGYRLSGLSMPIPKLLIYGFVFLLFLSALEEEDSLIAWKDKIVLIGVSAAVILLIMLSMFIGWTMASTTSIVGVQGRYFIPILPLLFIAIRGKTITLKRPVSRFCMTMAALINIYTLSYVLDQTLRLPL